MTVFHIDSNKYKLQWDKIDNGSYKAFMALGVANLPLEYKDLQGNKFIETISEEELFKDSSLYTAYGLPITFNHPKLGTYNQNQENILVGSTLQNFLNQDSTLLVESSITDKRAIALIDSILDNQDDLYAEISPGYWAEKVLNQYKNIIEQKNRKYDHVALLPVGAGRGGQKIVLRTDSNTIIQTSIVTENVLDTYEDDYSKETIQKEITNVTTRTIQYKNQSYDVPTEIADYLEDSSISTGKLQKNLAEANGKIAAMQITIDGKKEMITLDQASEIIKESIALWQVVEPIFKNDNKDFVPDYSLNPVQIKELYLKRFHPTVNCDGNDFINGAWSVIAPDIQNQQKNQKSNKVQAQLDSLQSIAANQTVINSDSVDHDIEAARKEQTERILKNGKL